MGEENKQPFADIETNQQMTVGKINPCTISGKEFLRMVARTGY